MDFPQGFRCAGTECGIKTSGKDIGLIVSDLECVASGVYTQNLIRAACIDFNRSITPSSKCRGLVVNSGNANACTGEVGKHNCMQTAEWVAEQIGCQAEQVLVLSTGVIGEQLPMAKIATGIDRAYQNLSDTESAFDGLAESFMTTDKYSKTKTRTFDTSTGAVKIAGIAKGAGMIGPNMATMLCTIMTDAVVTPEESQSAIEHATKSSFNKISVDGHTSTNDAVVLLSSGRVELDSKQDKANFQKTLNNICLDLAKMIPADGEGASHLVEIAVVGAVSEFDADKIARTVATSNLVKTAINGCDPNWGRIVSAAGYAGVDLDPSEIGLSINGVTVFRAGSPVAFSESEVSQSMASQKEVAVELTVGNGPHNGVHWTSDLTTDYVILNSDYRT